jgi:GT2 family glycosyltransferase
MISIITPVWNRAHLTAQYLISHNIHYPNPPDIEWIIIDNGSSDNTQGYLDYWKLIFDDSLQIIRNGKNIGFPAACNQGAKVAKGEVLLFLNNDIIVRGDYISPIERQLKDYPDSLVGPQLIDFDTGWNVFDGEPLQYLVGWCLAMRRETYDLLGGFDERYSPAYYEDIDLCYNALQNNIKLRQVWLPLEHIGEQSGHQLRDRRGVTEANRATFAEKWGLNYESE